MSAIDFSRLRSLTARELVHALVKDGFYLERQSGSHQQFLHKDGRRVTVTFHRPGDTFGAKLLRIMLEDQAKWAAEDLDRLDLL